MSTEREELDHAIWALVLASCCAHDGGEPHATTWARGGYRNDVPTLCERCEKLIRQLQELTLGYRKQEPASEPEVEAAAREIFREHYQWNGHRTYSYEDDLPEPAKEHYRHSARAALAAARAVTNGETALPQ